MFLTEAFPKVIPKFLTTDLASALLAFPENIIDVFISAIS